MGTDEIGGDALMACYQTHIDPALQGQRLDAALRRTFPELPSWALRDAFTHRDVKVDGKRVKADLRVHGGEWVQVYVMEQSPALDVVYEDANLLLINKRPGISVTEDAGGGATLTDMVARYARQRGEAVSPQPVHRLDNQTSGLVLFAKNQEAQAILEDAFRERLPKKEYTCLVRGIPKPPQALCRAYLTKDAAAAHVTIHDHETPGSKPIATAYETLEAGPISRLRVELITGRTHQIRAHMAALGHPLLGDDVYGDRAFNRANKARRLMLCATRLTLYTGGRLPEVEGHTFTISCPF